MPTVRINNINISYKTTGQGEPLFLINGWSADQSLWSPQVLCFKRHFQVITFDNRGSGKSDKPEGPYSIRMMADDTIGLMNHLGIEKAHMMGTSMGGMIAQEIAINYPQRILKLILASTYACRDNQSSGPDPELVKALQSSHKVGMVLVSRAYNKPLSRFSVLLTARIRSKFTDASIKAVNKKGFKNQLEGCLKHNTLERLSLIKAPTLVITGTQDRAIQPSSSDAIASRISNAKLVKIENGSHIVNREMKSTFNRQILNFLKS